jgi:SAM-dependent methyltransferase
MAGFQEVAGSLEGKTVLELGCGGGVDTILASLQPVRQVVGVDTRLNLFSESAKGNRVRRLLSEVLKQVGSETDIERALTQLPVRFETLDATGLPFPDDSFDVIVSNSTLEHLIPLEDALRQMRRVLRPGGLMYHSVDPFFSLRGCHRHAMIDIPWAQARLSVDELLRFVEGHEGPERAELCRRQLADLNHFTLERWRQVVKASSFEVLEWREKLSERAMAMLDEFPEVLETLLDGVCQRDLVHEQVTVVMRDS